jgi:hypothetical protein
MRTLAEIVPLRTSACREAVDAVGMIAAGEEAYPPAAVEHVSGCLRCQAEVAAYRRVLRTMRTMRDDLGIVPGGPFEAVLRPDGAGPPPWAVRAAYVGGITAAGAAGMIVWLSRRHAS